VQNIVDTNNQVVVGTYTPESNFRTLGRRKTGYASHCGGGNSWVIGVALSGGTESRPLTEQQCERAWELIASLCLEYDIPITEATVYTHYEFGLKNPRTVSRGKLDINKLWHEPKLKPGEVGNYIRNKVTWYYNKLNKETK
jgi:hypothetical protein